MNFKAMNGLYLLLLFLATVPIPSLAESDWKFYGKTSVEKVCVDTFDRKWFVTKDSLCVLDETGWRSFSEAELGFPMSSIIALEAAPDSSVWLGTINNGAIRYTDAGWQTYINENSGLGSNRVNAVAFDDSGGVWFLTPDSCMILRDGIWSKLLTFTSTFLWRDAATCMAVASSQLAYLGTKGDGVEVNNLYYYHYINNKNMGLPDNAVLDIKVASDGRAIFGTADGISILKDSKIKSFPGYSAQFVCIDSDGTIWFANQNGFFCCDGENITEFPNQTINTGENSIKYGNGICEMAVDRGHNLWFATWRGIYRFSGRFAHLVFPKGDRFGPPSYMAGSSLKIPWMSRYVENVRLEYSLDAGESWNLITSSIKAEYGEFGWTIPYNLVPAGYVAISVKLRLSAVDDPSICHTAEIQIQNPGFSTGLTEFNRDTNELISRPVEMIVEDFSGVKWLGNYSLIRFDGTQWQKYTTENSGFVSSGVNDLTVDSQGNLWCATYSGLFRYDGSTWRSWFKDRSVSRVRAGGGVVWAVCADQSSPVWSLYRLSVGDPEPERVMDWNEYDRYMVDPYGNVWTSRFGEEDGVWAYRLKRFDGMRWSSWIFPDQLWIRSRAEPVLDSHGKVWGMTAYGTTIICFDEGNWKSYTFDEVDTGFQQFNSMTIDRNGVLWLTMDERICTFDGNQWKSMDQKHGWPFNRIGSLERIFIDRDNVKWIIGSDGFFRYDNRLVPVMEKQKEPRKFSIIANHPNPFNPSTAITFSLPSPGRATLAVYSITGQKIRVLVSERLAAGTHTVVWDGRDDGGQAVSAGVYLVRLEAQTQTEIHKMLLLK